MFSRHAPIIITTYKKISEVKIVAYDVNLTLTEIASEKYYVVRAVYP
jgi:hypothetical protein